MKTLLALLLQLAVTSLVASSARADDTALRRFAIIIGANDGGSDRVRLRYAGSDADAVARVIAELGGVAASDTWVLRDPDPRQVNAAFARAHARILEVRGRGQRAELIVYYSGHSDENGLLLGGQRYGYRDLRATIAQMPSDVNIAVLDSCASGAFTRLKGGKRQPSFLVDESSKVRGYAFLSSSSDSEAAQESDRIAASFFTHYFVSGLRGAADANGDGRVTLSEAYRFAFDETVRRTEGTQAGPQHPAYDMHLVGTGDVVMTDLRATSARLILAADVIGRVLVRDGKGRLVVELSKAGGQAVTLGLGAGRYAVTWIAHDRTGRASIDIAADQNRRLAAADFHRIAREEAVARGDAPPEGRQVMRVSVVPPVTSAADTRTTAAFSLNILAGVGGPVEGVELGGLVNVVRGDVEGVQIAGLSNLASGNVRGVQVGGIANTNAGDMRGVQVGGIANVNGGNGEGWQVGGIANVNRGSFEGLQIGGIANVNARATTGAQIGLVNVGGTVRGAQIGLVNIATRASGLQLGLVNVAREHDGAPIGLLSWVQNGRHSFEAWTSDTALAHVGAKLGSRRVYGVLAAATTTEGWQAGAGVGVHIPLGTGYLDVDALIYEPFERDFDDADLELLTKFRIQYGHRLAPHLAVFGGITGNFSFDEDEPADNPSYFGGAEWEKGGITYRITPGFIAGLSF